MIYGEDLYNSYFDEDDINYVSEKSFSDGFDFACRLYAEKEKDELVRKHLINISDIDSKRGYGRGFLLGDLGGLAGTYAGSKHAEKLDRQGKLSSEEIEEAAGRRGAAVGALTRGGLSGAIGGATALSLAKKKAASYGKKLSKAEAKELKAYNKKLALAAAGATALGAGAGALGGYFGARKNVRSKAEKRDLLEYRSKKNI